MAKIVDPDQLNQATEIIFDTAFKTIDLAPSGNLDDIAPGKSSGVTHQALYSFTKEEWLADALLQPIRFPFDPIFEAKFDWINDWQPNSQQTKDLIRDGGFRVVLLDEEYASIISLQNIDAPLTDKAYYWQSSSFIAVTSSFDKTGELNEPISILSGTIGTNDYRDFLKVALRVQAKTYAEGNLLVDQDLAALTYQAYRLPLANTADPNIVDSDVTIDGSSPYTEIQLSFIRGSGFSTWATVTYPAESVVFDPNVQVSGSSNGSWWFTDAGGTSTNTDTSDDGGVTDWLPYFGQEQIGTEWFAFNRVMDTSSGTATKEQFYQWSQRQLRSEGEINDDLLGAPNQDAFGSVTGSVARLISDFVGTQLVTRGGVLIRNFDPNDTNSITLQDITVDGGGLDVDSVPLTTTERNFPFVAAGVLVFSDNLVAEPDVDTLYKMFFQYTTRDTGTDIAVTAAAGATATLTSSTTDFTVNFADTEYVNITGFTNAVNNGLYQVDDAAISATTMDVRKVNAQTLIDETSGNTVNLDSDPYDSPDAIIVDDNSGTDITGQITAASIAFDFDYDNNVQGGRTSGTDAPVAVIAQGTSGAQWVDGLFTLSQATGLSFPLNAATERVYANP